MKNVWIYQRAGRPGFYVGWYDKDLRRKAKAFPKLEWAKKYQALKVAQLNSDLGIFKADETAIPWQSITEEYIQRKKTDGLEKVSVSEIENTLLKFNEIANVHTSHDLKQGVFDRYVTIRAEKVARPTLNKDIRNLKAFLKWAKTLNYVGEVPILKQLKVAKKPDPPLTNAQVKNLLIASEKYPGWRERCLLALCTGLRRDDIEALTVSCIDFESNSVHTASQKTGKAMSHRPLPKEIALILKEYVATLPKDTEKLWTDTHLSRKWKKIRNEAKLPGLKFHKLRKQFGSELAQSGASTALVSDMLEHASEQTTKEIYINLPNKDYRKAVKKLPVKKWI